MEPFGSRFVLEGGDFFHLYLNPVKRLYSIFSVLVRQKQVGRFLRAVEALLIDFTPPQLSPGLLHPFRIVELWGRSLCCGFFLSSQEGRKPTANAKQDGQSIESSRKASILPDFPPIGVHPLLQKKSGNVAVRFCCSP